MSMSVCLSTRITRKPNFTNHQFLCMLRMAVARSSCAGVAICTSGFVDERHFSHNGPMVRQVLFLSGDKMRQAYCNSRDSNRILLSDKDQQMLIMNCAPGAKSATYDCFVVAAADDDDDNIYNTHTAKLHTYYRLENWCRTLMVCAGDWSDDTRSW